MNTGSISRGIGFDSYTFRVLKDLEGEVARLSPLLRIQVRAREGQGSNPTSSATRAGARATLGCSSVEERVFGEHEAAGAIPVIPTNVRIADILFCRRCEERDTILRRSMVEVRILPAAPRLSSRASFFSGPEALGYPSTDPAPITCPARSCVEVCATRAATKAGPAGFDSQAACFTGRRSSITEPYIRLGYTEQPSSILLPVLRRGLVTRLDSKSDRAGFNS